MGRLSGDQRAIRGQVFVRQVLGLGRERPAAVTSSRSLHDRQSPNHWKGLRVDSTLFTAFLTSLSKTGGSDFNGLASTLWGYIGPIRVQAMAVGCEPHGEAVDGLAGASVIECQLKDCRPPLSSKGGASQPRLAR